ncbi:MAG TPA: HEAT repeat domain-containing protein [Aggregatilineales bacterium]|nr:HEAT repeat domain-containing protein [Aggregatilineales bacterium]
MSRDRAFDFEYGLRFAIDQQLLRQVLTQPTVESVQQLMTQVEDHVTDPYYGYEIAETILERVIGCLPEAEVLVICKLIRDMNWGWHGAVKTAAQLSLSEAISFIRESVETVDMSDARQFGTELIARSVYHDDYEAVLAHEGPAMRVVAVLRLEAEEKTSALIPALSHSDVPVRRIAAWYMGRKQVREAATQLRERLSDETDIEVLRGVIWSVGVLRDQSSIHLLRSLCQHPTSLIASTAAESLIRIESA